MNYRYHLWSPITRSFHVSCLRSRFIHCHHENRMPNTTCRQKRWWWASDGTAHKKTNEKGKNPCISWVWQRYVGHNNGTSHSSRIPYTSNARDCTTETNQNLVVIRWQRDIITKREMSDPLSFSFFFLSCLRFWVKLMTPSRILFNPTVPGRVNTYYDTEIRSIWYSCVIISHTSPTQSHPYRHHIFMDSSPSHSKRSSSVIRLHAHAHIR